MILRSFLFIINVEILFNFYFYFVQDYGHRVRLATHANFKDFVLTAGLEFYPLGGDPKVLAECMY